MLARFAKATGTTIQAMMGRRMTHTEFHATHTVAQEWSLAETLLVAIAERIDMLRYMYQTIHSDPRTPAPVAEPLRVPRPGEKPVEPKRVGAAEFAEAMRRGGDGL